MTANETRLGYSDVMSRWMAATQPVSRAAVETTMSFQDHSPRHAANLLRPYLLVAVFAFALGFSAYLALGWTAQAAAPSVEAWPAPASAPAAPQFVDERHI